MGEQEPTHVMIGPVDLYLPDSGSITDRGLNPSKIRWYKSFHIEEKPIVRSKPHTQCTQPLGLWCCEMQFTVLNMDNHIALKALNAGPYMVQTATMYESMWIKEMSFEQVEGTDDDTFEWIMQFKEQYPI